MKTLKKFLSIMMAIVTLVSVVSISAEALTVSVEDRNYGYMVPVNNKGTKVLSSVKLYGEYDYLNFFIHSGSSITYFFYEIYSDSKLTNCIESGYTACEYGNYNMSQKIKLKGTYKSKTYYVVTYAGKFSSDKESLTVDENSLCQFKMVVDRSPSYDEKIVPLNSVTNTLDGPKITWTKISSSSKYYIYRRSITGTKFTKIGAVSGKKSSFVDTAIKRKDGNYIYTVKGIAENGVASRYHYNGITCLYAETPTINTASVIGDNGIYIEWKKTDGDAKYYIYRKENDGDWERVEDYYANYYTDKNVENGKEYSYRVKSIIDCDDYGKAKSAYSVATENIKFLSAPVMNELEIKENSIGISWNLVEGATGYSILRKPLDSDDAWTVLATVSGEKTTYEDITASLIDGAYVYTVRSEGDGFSGSYSSGKEYFTLAEPEFTVTVDADGVYMKWDEVPYATAYRIYEQNEDGNWEVKTRVRKNYYEFKPSTYYNKKLSVCATRTGGLSSYKTDVEPTQYFPKIPLEIKEYESYTKFDWNGTGADKYRLYRKLKDVEGATYELFYESTTPGFSDASPVEDVAYTYHVRGVYGDIEQNNNYASKTHIRYSTETCIESFKVAKKTVIYNRWYNGYDDVNEYYDFEVDKTDAFKKATTNIYYMGRRSEINDGWENLYNVSRIDIEEDLYYAVEPLRFSCVVSTSKGNSTPIGANTVYVAEESCEVPDVTLNPTSKGFKLTWNEVEGAVKYVVTVDFAEKTDYRKSFKADGSKTHSVTFSDIDYGRSMSIKVSAVHENGNVSTRSIGNYTVEKAPKLVAAVKANFTDSVNLFWSTGDHEGYFAVWRKAEGESKWTCISKKYYDHTVCSMNNGVEYRGFVYDDKTAKKGVKYTYTVRYYDPESKAYTSYYNTKGVSIKL